MSCPDAVLADILGPLARVWAARVGGKVELTTAPMVPDDQVDIGAVRFADLGAWAERGDLVPVPASLKDASHPYQWSGVFAVYRSEPYAGWGDELFGLPLAGDGFVLVCNTDRFADQQAKFDFQRQTSRPLQAPTSWEDLATVAAFFAARDKRPSLPSLPTDPARLTDWFFRVATCYDRSSSGETSARGSTGQAAGPAGESLAFQFQVRDGQPRIGSISFTTAAEWLALLRQRGCVPTDGPTDPVAAVTEGRAVMAVLSLAEVARLRGTSREADRRFGIFPLPGSRSCVNASTGQLVPSTGNYVPYFAGGWIGVVRKRCSKPDAGFDLLAELGGPVRSAEVIAATGYGPFRDTHLDTTRPAMWYGYGFDADRTKALQEALQGYIGKAIRNPTYGLRGPDHLILTNVLADELKQIIAGNISPTDGMKRAAATWTKATAETAPAKLASWRRKAVGLN
jgi:ABC-type glycerol-3-phosphate transport system substrate-binding protein